MSLFVIDEIVLLFYTIVIRKYTVDSKLYFIIQQLVLFYSLINVLCSQDIFH